MDDQRPVAVGDVLGGYRLEKALGAGSVSRVFLASHLKLGRRVAIKVLTGALAGEERVKARFIAEARIVNDIRHPNIIDISDFLDAEPGRLALVMELIEGPSLKRLRVEGRRLSFVQAIGVTLQLIEALAAAHALGVIHRDLKPDNLLLLEDPPADTHLIPWLKVVDFGIAKVNEGGVEKTATGIMIGTPAYMAPEQIAGKPPPSPATDVYAVGEILYELLSGQRAFPQGSINETIQAKLRNQLPPLDTLDVPGSVAIEAVIVKCLDQRPHARPRLDQMRSLLVEVCPEAERYQYRGGPISVRPPRSEAATVEPPTRAPAVPSPSIDLDDSTGPDAAAVKAAILGSLPIAESPTTAERPPFNLSRSIPAAETAPSSSTSGPAPMVVAGRSELDLGPDQPGTEITMVEGEKGDTKLTPSKPVLVSDLEGSPFDDRTTAVGFFASIPRQVARTAKRSPWLIVALGSSAMALTAAVWITRHDDAAPAPVTLLPPPAATIDLTPRVEAQQRPRVEVRSIPSGARVEEIQTGRTLGTTPLEFDLGDSIKLRIRIALDDYEPVVVLLSPSSPKVEVELVKRARTKKIEGRSIPESEGPKPPTGPSGDFPSW